MKSGSGTDKTVYITAKWLQGTSSSCFSLKVCILPEYIHTDVFIFPARNTVFGLGGLNFMGFNIIRIWEMASRGCNLLPFWDAKLATWTHSQEHETLCEKVHMWAFCVESYKFLPCGLHVYGDYYARSTTHQVRNNPPFPSLFSYITFCAALNSSLAISPQRHDVFFIRGPKWQNSQRQKKEKNTRVCRHRHDIAY